MKTQQYIAFVLLAIGAVVAIYGASRPDAGLLKFKVKDNIAYGYGGTSDWSVHQVKNFFNDNPHVDTFVLKKMPGTIDANMNMRIARDIRRRGLKTHLESNSYIASGAVDLFLAGTQRTMECGALIGVHSWSSGKHYYPAKIGHDPEQKKHEKFLTEMGIDPSFYAFTRDAALPHDIYYLKMEEIRRFGLLTEDVECE